MPYVKTTSSWHKDLVVSFLRAQIATLQRTLGELENSDRFENGHLEESLSRAEKELRNLRKTFVST